MNRLIACLVILAQFTSLSLGLAQKLEPSDGGSGVRLWRMAGSSRNDWEERSDRGEAWTFEQLPRHIGNDLKYSFWNGWHLLFLAAGAGTTAIVHEFDPDIREAFQPERPFGKTFDDVMNWGFHPFVLAGATALAFGAFKGFGKGVGAEKSALTAGTMFEALAITETLTFGLQLATHRGRPDGSNSRSFPSGHTSGVFALATVAEVYYGPWVGIPSYMLASLVGVSRIDGNKHAASDVVAGAVLGTLIGLGTAKWHKKEFSNFFVTPVIGDGQTGVAVTHSF
jgi:membrane-associated phospholipid phosphatase